MRVRDRAHRQMSRILDKKYTAAKMLETQI